jgi:hypothetical protein
VDKGRCSSRPPFNGAASAVIRESSCSRAEARGPLQVRMPFKGAVVVVVAPVPALSSPHPPAGVMETRVSCSREEDQWGELLSSSSSMSSDGGGEGRADEGKEGEREEREA